MASIDHILQSVFRLQGFRPRQREIISDVLAGHDVLCVMPTGAGKSLCFQLPGVAGDGLTLIVSPLISLMADQVRHLRALGVKAMYLNSSQEPDIQRKVVQVLENNWSGLLYIAPERFSPAFVRMAAGWRVRLFVVDEAHCVSFWGHDFRPEYMRLAEIRQQLGSPTTMAVTATATPQVRDDIVKMLALRDPKIHITGFDRPNLAYSARRFERDRLKDDAALRFVKRHQGSGIIYCATRRGVEELGGLLQSTYPSRAITTYHAGMSAVERKRNQATFMEKPDAVAVATNAFGMGINKPDIRFVLHYNLPGSVEAYYQEAGRAGRDGAPAECVLYFSNADLRTQHYFIDQIGVNNAELGEREIERLRKNAERKLYALLNYASWVKCRRRMILEYFGQRAAIADCRCDICGGGGDHRWAPEPGVQRRPVRQFERELDAATGGGHRWSPEPTAAPGSPPANASLNAASASKATSRAAGPERVSPARKGWDKSARAKRGPEGRQPPLPEPPLDDAAKTRFETLRKVRMHLATENGWPPFCIFHDRVLREIARTSPQSVEDFAEIKGVGATKAAKFGPALLAAIKT